MEEELERDLHHVQIFSPGQGIDLHDQQHREFQQAAQEGYENEERLRFRRRSHEDSLSGNYEDNGKMDPAHPKLGTYPGRSHDILRRQNWRSALPLILSPENRGLHKISRNTN